MDSRLYLCLLVVVAGPALACPGCAGSMENPKDGSIVYILAGFIMASWIPFYVLYRMIIKNRNINNTK